MHRTQEQQSPDIVPLTLADRLPNASHDVVVRGYRTQPPKITLSEIPTCMTPGQLRSGAQLHQERLESFVTKHPNKTSNMIDIPMYGSTRTTIIPLFPEEWFVKLSLVWTGDFQVAGTHLRP